MNRKRQADKLNLLAPELLLAAYAAGCFPMAESRGGKIQWFSPDPRAIIPLGGLNVSRSLRQTMNKNIFEITWSAAFEQVMRECSEREETWISEEIIQSYVGLHHLGAAHSVEAWSKGALVGGLYGVALGAAFFGESMFSRTRDASKVALVSLVERLRAQRFELLDIQFMTPHLARLGALEIPRTKYLDLLGQAVNKRRTLIA